MKVGSGRAVRAPVRGFELTRFDVNRWSGMRLGGHIELRLANGEAPPSLFVVVVLPPPLRGEGAGCSAVSMGDLPRG